MTYKEAVRELNLAAYNAIRACRDTTKYPNVNREKLRQISNDTDRLFEAGEEFVEFDK